MQKITPQSVCNDQQPRCCRSSTNMLLHPLTVLLQDPTREVRKYTCNATFPLHGKYTAPIGGRVLPWLRSHKIPCLAVKTLQPWPSYFTSKKATRIIKVAFHFPNFPFTSCKRNNRTINVILAIELARTLSPPALNSTLKC